MRRNHRQAAFFYIKNTEIRAYFCNKFVTESYEVEYLYTIASTIQDGYGRMEWDIENLMKNGTFGYANPGIIKCVALNLKPF